MAFAGPMDSRCFRELWLTEICSFCPTSAFGRCTIGSTASQECDARSSFLLYNVENVSGRFSILQLQLSVFRCVRKLIVYSSYVLILKVGQWSDV